jgi:hypothetical protein
VGAASCFKLLRPATAHDTLQLKPKYTALRGPGPVDQRPTGAPLKVTRTSRGPSPVRKLYSWM